MSVQIETRQAREGTAVLTVGGELDVYSSPALKQALIDLLDGGAHVVVVHLNGVGYLDSTGLGVLLGGMRRAAAKGGSLTVACDEPRILRILEITGLARLLRVCATEEEALAACAQ